MCVYVAVLFFDATTIICMGVDKQIIKNTMWSLIENRVGNIVIGMVVTII